MKKLVIFFAAFAVLATGCKKDKDENNDDNTTPVPTLNPVQQQWGFTINYTATWCGYCGSWGADKLEELSELNSGKVLAIAAHASNDPMHVSAIYSSFTSDRKTGGGIPSFWVGNEKATSSQAVPKMNTLLSQTPIAAIDMKATKKTGLFEVEAKVKFFSASTGDYYLSFYILEDGIPGTGSYQQSGNSDPNFAHNHVMRKVNSTNAYGELLATNPVANATFDKNFNFEFNTSWDNTLYVAAAIWKYNPNGDPANMIPKYEFINGFVVK